MQAQSYSRVLTNIPQAWFSRMPKSHWSSVWGEVRAGWVGEGEQGEGVLIAGPVPHTQGFPPRLLKNAPSSHWCTD